MCFSFTQFFFHILCCVFKEPFCADHPEYRSVEQCSAKCVRFIFDAYENPKTHTLHAMHVNSTPTPTPRGICKQ